MPVRHIPLSERYPDGFGSLKRTRLIQLAEELESLVRRGNGEPYYCTGCKSLGLDGYVCPGCESDPDPETD